MRRSASSAGRRRTASRCARIAAASTFTTSRRAAASVRRLPPPVLGHARDDPGVAQDGLRGSARRDLHPRQRRQGRLRVAARARSRLPAQDGFRARAQDPGSPCGRNDRATRWPATWKSMAHISAATSAPRTTREDRVDRRLAEHQTGKRRVVVALRQRKGRTLTFVVTRRPKASVVRTVSPRRPSFMPTKPRTGTCCTAWYTAQRINHRSR